MLKVENIDTFMEQSGVINQFGNLRRRIVCILGRNGVGKQHLEKYNVNSTLSVRASPLTDKNLTSLNIPDC